jgi:hypothetical protein
VAEDHVCTKPRHDGGRQVTNSQEEAYARIRRGIAQAEDNVRRSNELAREMEELRVRGSSRDGRAEVVLTSTGALVDVRLADDLEGAPVADVRAAILQASAAARQQVQHDVVQVARRHFGDHSRTAEQFEDYYARAVRIPDADDGGRGTDR